MVNIGYDKTKSIKVDRIENILIISIPISTFIHICKAKCVYISNLVTHTHFKLINNNRYR